MLNTTFPSYLLEGSRLPSKFLELTMVFGGFEKMGLTLLSLRLLLDLLAPNPLRFIGLGLRLVLLNGFFLAISFSF